MKTISKIFMALAVLVAYSCATDLTEDLGVQLSNGEGQTTITLSLEESRTQLGAEVNDTYPLYWSEGDCISVNGIASEPLTAEQAGKATATFIVNVVADNYNIAYPATADGQVLFAESQLHTANNTFGNGVSTMYATCAKGSSIRLNHLTSVLKIGVVGSATLTHAQISTIDRAPIAGEFAIDYESGKVTATAAAKSVINYSFGEGVTLSSEPTYIHVAVPAGIYDELYVTLYDNAEGVMYATVEANENKPLKVGKLREFTNHINYAATDKVVVINDYADLKAFAAVAAETTANVILTNDIEVNEAWTPIEGYAGTVYGHGYAIKGLTAPLFGTTSASFNGLHLDGVAINETANPNVGAFARKVVATETIKPTISNCSASGTLTVNCTEFVLGENNSRESFAIGGLVGHIKGVDLSDVTSSVSIDVDQVIATGNTAIIYPSVAGIVGLVDVFAKADESVVTCDLINCENKGAIDVNEVSYTSANYKSPIVPWIAGVAARFVSDNHDCVVKNIINRGNITLQGCYGEGKTATNTKEDGSAKAAADIDDVNYNDIDPCLGGVFGYIQSKNCSNVHNYGTVTYSVGYSRFHYVGGIAGMCGKNSVLDDVHNHGTITLSNKVNIASLHCAGVVAHTIAESSLTNSSNSGDIIAKSVPVSGKSGHRFHRIGGVVGFADGSVKNCHNLKESKIDCGGTILSANNWRDVCFGGVVAYKESNPIENCSNSGEMIVAVNIKYSATDSTVGGLTDTSKRFSIGGVVGLTAQPCNNVTNNGNITIYGQAHGMYVGGCVGDMNYAGDKGVGGYYNNGVINFKTHATYALNRYYSYIGGCIGYAKGTIKTAENNGTLQIDGTTFHLNCHLGGCVGCIDKETGIVDGAINSAAININGTTFASNGYIGGVVGRVADATATAKNLTNNGPIEVLGNVQNTHTSNGIHIGGCVGDIKGAVESITNNAGGTITITSAELSAGPFFAGCVGRTEDAAGTVTSATNHATINITDGLKLGAKTLRVGGCVAHTKSNITTATNNGAIILGSGSENPNSFAGAIQVGGVIAQTEISKNPTVEGAINKGSITINATSASASTYDYAIGGLIARSSTACTVKDSHNAGTLTIGSKAVVAKTHLMVGGITGTINAAQTYNNCYNSGAVIVEEGVQLTAAKDLYMGGLVGYLAADITINAATDSTPCGFRNTGSIKVYNKATVGRLVYAGGIAGHTTKVVRNAETVCDIVAPGVVQAGMIVGTSHGSSPLVDNCKLGGRIAKELANGEPVYKTLAADKVMVEGSNDEDGYFSYEDTNFIPFWNVIYGVWDGANKDNTDNCKYISEIKL